MRGREEERRGRENARVKQQLQCFLGPGLRKHAQHCHSVLFLRNKLLRSTLYLQPTLRGDGIKLHPLKGGVAKNLWTWRLETAGCFRGPSLGWGAKAEYAG